MQNSQKEPQLPQELTDMIIDHLHTDKQSLFSCSQVARSWLKSSQFHLFRKTSIAVSQSNPSKLHDFINLLHPSRYICLHIRYLILHKTYGDPSKASLNVEVIATILSKLPNISRFFCSGMHLTLPSVFGSKDRCVPPLQHLTFISTEIYGSLSSVLSYFTRVDILELFTVLTERPNISSAEVAGPDDAHSQQTVAPLCLGLRSLMLGVNGQTRNHPIHQGIQMESLTSFDFAFSDPSHLYIAGAIIRLAPCLRHLKLCLQSLALFNEAPGSEEWEELSLASTTSLETLAIEMTLDLPPKIRDFDIWSSVRSLVASAPKSLSNILFNDLWFDLEDLQDAVSDLESFNWESLRQSLSMFSELRSVGFNIGFSEYQTVDFGGSRNLSEKMKEVIHHKLWNLHQKGKVQVEFEVEE